MSDQVDRLAAALADRYTIERELGRGGMAVVYLAQDQKLNRQVAVKVLRPELAASLGSERFLREIEIAAKLTHPNILALYDCGEADSLLYYTMPFVKGESLRDRLKREKQLPVEDAIQITREVADALGHAHSLGIVHRDIKPENILFTAGHAVVSDFGIARAVSEAGGTKLTETGLTVGTPAYMSPEQATATQEVDGRTDLYSLGCVLYEMLAGEVPYSGPTPMAVVAKKLSEPLPRVSVVREAIPPAVEAALNKALARTPADRFKTAEQFVAALESGPSRFVIPKQRVRLPVAAVAGAVLLAAGAYVVWQATRPFTVTVSNPRQVTFDPGLEDSPSISPDGGDVAYITGGALYVQSLSGGTPLRLADRGGGPSWSPDGERVVFSAASGSGTTFAFHEVGRLGGPSRVLERQRAALPEMAPDGTHYVGFEKPSADTVEIYIYVVGREDKGKQLFARSGGWAGGRNPGGFAWSPDGRRIAYPEGDTSPANEYDVSAIWVVLDAGAEPIRVTDSEHCNTSPVWLPDNRHLLFVSDRDGPRDIYMVDAEEPGEPQRVTFGGQNPHGMSLSADGKRLAFSKYQFRRNIWAVPIPAEGIASIREGKAVTAVGWNQLIEDHDISPDGDTLAFTFRDDPRGQFHVYKMPLGEWDHRSQLTADSADDYLPVWSPNGREIVFGRLAGPEGDEAWVMDADGGNKSRVMDIPGYGALCDWSSDGLQVVCGRGRAGVWMVARDSVRQGFDMPVAFGEPTLWYDGACSFLRRVKGGTGFVCDHLYEEGFKSQVWLSPEGTVVRRLDATPREEAIRKWNGVIRGNATESETPLLWWVKVARYAPDGSMVYFFANPGGAVYLMSMPAEGGEPRRVVAFDDPSIIPGVPANSGERAERAQLTVGKDMLYFSVGESESDIWVMDLEW